MPEKPAPKAVEFILPHSDGKSLSALKACEVIPQPEDLVVHMRARAINSFDEPNHE